MIKIELIILLIIYPSILIIINWFTMKQNSLKLKYSNFPPLMINSIRNIENNSYIIKYIEKEKKENYCLNNGSPVYDNNLLFILCSCPPNYIGVHCEYENTMIKPDKEKIFLKI